MGFFDFFKKKDKKEEASSNTNTNSLNITAEPGKIYQPETGNVITLEQIPDPVFSSGALGQGCGIEPTVEVVYSPIDATVSTVADTKHAIGLTASNGLEMLIHVGIDTVNMQGEGFNVLVKPDQTVKAGDPLLTFSKDAIANAGYKDTTAVLVINAADYPNFKLTHTGQSEAGSVLFTY